MRDRPTRISQVADDLLVARLNRRSMLKRSLGMGLAIPVFGGLLAACGGDDDDPDPTPGTEAAPTQVAETTPADTADADAEETPDTDADETPDTDADETPDTDADETPAARDDAATGVTMTIPLITTIDVTLDPNKAQNWVILGNLYPYIYGGLVTYDADAVTMPDLAESWEISDDGLEYTFHIREDARFANGRDVVADDFIYSWKRTIDPEAPSPSEHFLEHMQGYREFIDGEADEIGGVERIDDKTLHITLSRPYNIFLSYMCYYPWFVVDHELVEQHGDSNNSNWTTQGAYGTGPWQVSHFDPATGIELIPNEHYYGERSPSVTAINLPILKGPVAANTGLNLYKGAQAHILPNFPIALLDAVENEFPDEMQWIDVGGTQSIAMTFTKEPFDNVLVRRAFGMAIDRDTLCNEIWRGTRKPTSCYIPPSVPDYDCPEGILYDPEEAQRLLEAAGYPGGQGLPTITIYQSSELSTEDINRWRALAEMWNATLGSDVQIDTSMTLSQIIDRRIEQQGFQMEIMGWINITETPQLMSEVMRSDSPYMVNRFDWGTEVPVMEYNGEEFDPAADSRRFDELVHQADVETDADLRNELYFEAETLMLRNAVYVPFGNYRFPSLVKPEVRGTVWGAYYYNLPMPIAGDVHIEGA